MKYSLNITNNFLSTEMSTIQTITYRRTSDQCLIYKSKDKGNKITQQHSTKRKMDMQNIVLIGFQLLIISKYS